MSATWIIRASVSLFRLRRDRRDDGVVKPLCLGAQILVLTDRQARPLSPAATRTASFATAAAAEFCEARAEIKP
jgi:hypothetical protein